MTFSYRQKNKAYIGKNFFSILSIIVLIMLLSSCKEKHDNSLHQVPVKVAHAEQVIIPQYITAYGSLLSEQV